MSSLMKPCPCCGLRSTVKIMRTSESEVFDHSQDDTYAIICDFTEGGCGCCGGHRLELDEAIDVWNQRAQQPDSERDAARWRFMMAVAENEEGPEAILLAKLGADIERHSIGFNEREEMEKLVDAAMSAQKNDGCYGFQGRPVAECIVCGGAGCDEAVWHDEKGGAS